MDLDLNTRERLPDALRVLLETYPRETWEGHHNFGQLIRFWLDRHLMFRKMNKILLSGVEGYLDQRVDAGRYGRETARIGQKMLHEIHGHHTMEDTHYFPVLTKQDKRLIRGFEMLDADHHALDEHLAGFAKDANALLGALGNGKARDEAGRLHDRITGFGGFLDRHLTDEEDLIVPVLLHYDPEEFQGY
ncbi:Hemerythrin HHE cation binding domain-containing protein [Monaibacterium marinum]|uniref:Hemerythrin HHE cation binding domain-containing protein n=1 Tax=Pontivivens marinum TaxID=1690039 RepID=A0A2C9CSN9_9RHOB|nr:hemerythrin domain-containing protein [Monaibacterium marinum]SOH94531.1 Hemerythrin HHE cation binding domain-containing protein [Monaibacterium marinum]